MFVLRCLQKSSYPEDKKEAPLPGPCFGRPGPGEAPQGTSVRYRYTIPSTLRIAHPEAAGASQEKPRPSTRSRLFVVAWQGGHMVLFQESTRRPVLVATKVSNAERRAIDAVAQARSTS